MSEMATPLELVAALDELPADQRQVILLVALEGMSYGRCCLVSDIPPNIEALAGNGEQFRCGDSGDLAAKLDSLLSDPARRKKLGDDGRRHAVAEYSWDRVAALTAELYHSLATR